MKKYLQIGLSVSFLVGLLTLVACKDDDAPPTPSQLSFAVSSMTVNEADGVIEIEIVLDKPALEDFTVEYEVGGTAILNGDYEILEDLNDFEEVDFEKGDTKGIIEIELYSDLGRENDETIEIELTDVDSDLVEITRDDEIEITVEQEDGLLIELTWDDTDVDMDLLTWGKNNAGEMVLTGWNSARIGFSGGFEFIFLPSASVLPDGTYGLSCIYYEGTADPLEFAVSFYKVENGLEVSMTERLGSYGLVNINSTWDQTGGDDPILVQTFEKSGSDFTDFSEIEIPISGSRMIRSELPPGTLMRTKETVMTNSLKKN